MQELLWLEVYLLLWVLTVWSFAITTTHEKEKAYARYTAPPPPTTPSTPPFFVVQTQHWVHLSCEYPKLYWNINKQLTAKDNNKGKKE